MFVSLGLWQLDRAAEKKSLLSRFDGEDTYTQVSDYASLDEFARIQVQGEFLSDRQILIDNIVQGGRPGYYVITPFRLNTVEPLLLINRGWIPKKMPADVPDISVASGFKTVRGLVGRLPRVAIRPGDAFAEKGPWPRIAVYPRPEEIADALETRTMPIVLLLATDETNGFSRQWQPNISGPSTHYGYAVQWFAMAATVVALMVWNLRKRSRRV